MSIVASSTYVICIESEPTQCTADLLQHVLNGEEALFGVFIKVTCEWRSGLGKPSDWGSHTEGTGLRTCSRNQHVMQVLKTCAVKYIKILPTKSVSLKCYSFSSLLKTLKMDMNTQLT